MAEKNTSKRPSVVGRKTKVSNASVPSASAGKPEGLFRDSSKGAAHPMPRPSVPEGKKAKSSLNVETDSVSEKTGTPRMSAKAKSRKRRLSRRFVIIVCSVVAVLAIATGLLSWNQWLRYDDAADIQGMWVIDGSSATITVTDSEIKMSDDVSYSYSLDTFNKTISFSFGKYTGSGSYAFSPERDTLVITEENPDSEQGKASTKLVKQQ